MLCKYAQNKTADRLSRHLSTVMRKIREVIGNSLASKRSLLHSSPQLAYGGELSSKTLKNKTLRNYLDIQWRTLHDSTRGKTISAVRPVRPCARPLRAAASSCRTFARHLSPVTCRDPMHLCGQPCGPSMTQRSCTARIPLQQSSVNTVETPENSAHMFTDHTDATCPESGCCESSLTVFSIVKNQKIVNTETRKSFGFHCADAGARCATSFCLVRRYIGRSFGGVRRTFNRI